MKLHELLENKNVIKVTAADFNGKSFDGAPLVLAGHPPGTVMPSWVVSTLFPKINIEARGSTDYAWFAVPDDYGNVIWAGPGDYIIRKQWGPGEKDSSFTVMTGEALKAMGFPDLEALSLVLLAVNDLKNKVLDSVTISDKASRISSHEYQVNRESPREQVVKRDLAYFQRNAHHGAFAKNTPIYSGNDNTKQFPPNGDEGAEQDPNNLRV